MEQSIPLIPNADPLSLLPKELLDGIYDLVLHADNGPCVLTFQTVFEQSTDDRTGLWPLLKLPRNPQYRRWRSTKKQHVSWPDEVERALFRGLEWSLRHNDTGRGSMNMEIGRIIYELTGVYHNRKVISSHLQALKDCLTRMKSSVPILSDVRDSVHRLEELEATHDMGNIRETIKYLVEERLPDLLREFELEEMGHLAPERPAVRFGGQSAVTAHAEVFQMMSEMVPEGGDGRGLRLFVTGGPLTLKECPSWRKDFGITLVNRFHRTGALAALASNLVFDFTDNVDAFHRLQQRLPMGVSIRYMRLLFVEGHMDFGFAEFLASDGAVSVLPDLLEVLVELWPRDMKRGSYDSMEWGVQTVRLLELLTRWRGRVVVRWRFKTDCERFESEYVGVRGWRRMEGTEVEGGGPEEAMCQRDYEFKGK